jgi:hypothetical protein
MSSLYWTVMETLTAFVRESSELDAPDPSWQSATDITAVLEVIRRRPDAGRARERQQNWRINLSTTDLRGVDLEGVHLERAKLVDVQFERAWLVGAHLEGASLVEADLESAHLNGAHLEGANLSGAHLEGANLAESVRRRQDTTVSGYRAPCALAALRARRPRGHSMMDEGDQAALVVALADLVARDDALDPPDVDPEDIRWCTPPWLRGSRPWIPRFGGSFDLPQVG